MFYTIIEEQLQKAHETKWKTFGESDSTNRLASANSKGGLSHVINRGKPF